MQHTPKLAWIIGGIVLVAVIAYFAYEHLNAAEGLLSGIEGNGV